MVDKCIHIFNVFKFLLFYNNIKLTSVVSENSQIEYFKVNQVLVFKNIFL